jgi:uncharacterized membrane protein YkvA (DUF1232 family)
MAEQNNRSRRLAADDDETPPRRPAPRRRTALDDDEDDLVGPRTLSAPRLRRGGARGGTHTPADTVISVLKDLPHFGRLVYRVARDPRVNPLDKALVAAALVYAAMPADAIPDPIPFIGELDDVVVVGAALARLVNNCGVELLLEHWSGDPASLEAALDVVERGSNLLPAPLRGLLLAGGR